MSQEPHLDHFGLREPPFLLAPDPEYLYLSTQHSLAQAYLSYALLNRDSFVVLTGNTGTGKTTLINRLVATAGEGVAIARVAHTQLSPVELLQSILLSVGIRAFDKQRVELFSLWEEFTEQQHREGRQVLLAVDDAHHLNVDVLEEIRLATQVGARQDTGVNLILSGRPALRETLELPMLDQLRQRVRFAFELTALTGEETAEYITRRLRVAGGERDLFATACLPDVVRYTGGIPRLINILCDTALMSAFTEGAHEVTPATLRAAIDELDWQPLAPAADGVPRSLSVPAGAGEEEQDGEDGAADTFPDGPVPAALPGEEAPAVPEDARAVLTLVADGQPLGRYALVAERLTIGRERDNDVRIPAEYVSRYHAQVSWMRGGCWIIDLNSTNGTFVNGLRVRRRLLRSGDEIQFGRHCLHVSCAGPSPEAEAADEDDAWRETLVLAGGAGETSGGGG